MQRKTKEKKSCEEEMKRSQTWPSQKKCPSPPPRPPNHHLAWLELLLELLKIRSRILIINATA